MKKLFFLIVSLGFFLLSFFFVTKSEADSGEDITISANTTWGSGTYNYRDITITNNAVLTLKGTYTDNDDGVGVTINARKITVENGSSISALGTGYAGCAGPGAGTPGLSAGGGDYGGRGAQNATDKTYGSALNPTNLGSGGCANGSDAEKSGKGGGAITIIASDSVLIEGSISANGSNGLPKGGGYQTGGGSGGTINIKTSAITISGSITANGGNGYNNGGVGGGGRISIFYTSGDLTSSTITAHKGITGTLTGATDGTTFIYNTVNKNLDIISALTLKTDEGISSFGELTSDGNYYFNNVTLANNTTLYLKSSYTNNEDGRGIKLFSSGNFIINEGAKIDAVGAGYAKQSGPGLGGANQNFYGGGAGHGGKGGRGEGPVGGSTYGSTLYPTTLGSGGQTTNGVKGGGAIYIVANEITHNGTIDASAQSATGTGSANGSGGSGGSIYIKANTIIGTGAIKANGGNGYQYSGGGGGGRIALYADTSDFNLDNITTDPGLKGGTGTSADGNAGTIFVYNLATKNATVTNDTTFEANQGISPDGSFRNDGVYYFNNLTISNNANIQINGYWTDSEDGTGVTINLDGDLIITAGSTIAADSGGYTAELGQGPGQSGSSKGGSGGSYGGTGGLGYGTNPTQTYGETSKYAPYLLGSGGGNCSGANGGNGGGAIILRVIGDVIIDGSISANGGNGAKGLSDYGSGGGSGGSIFLTGNNISGSGIISANGGQGGADWAGGGGGGGGRVSIAYYNTFSMNENNITANGSAGSVTPDRDGDEGTVYIRKIELPLENFVLTNPNNNSQQYTNSLNVLMQPDDPNVKKYYKLNSETVTPPFFAPGWKNVNEYIELSGEEGEKNINAWLKDENDLITADVGSATIILDQTNPGLSLEQAQSSQTMNDSIKISGIATDALSGIDYISLNGQKISNLMCPLSKNSETKIITAEASSFQTTVNLNLGDNNFTFIVYDKAGNNISDSIKITRIPPPTENLGSSPDSSGSDQGTSQEQFAASDSTSTPSSESETMNFEQIDKDNEGDFTKEENKLIFYRSNPIISGHSQPNAIIEILLNDMRFQTNADTDGNWKYAFDNLATGLYKLTINEYTSTGDFIKSSIYELEIKEKVEEDTKNKSLFQWWWLLLLAILIILSSYWHFKIKSKKIKTDVADK